MEKDDKIALLTELLIDTEKKVLETEQKALQELTTIRKWVMFFGILTVTRRRLCGTFEEILWLMRPSRGQSAFGQVAIC